jgi:hypothetical protein
MLNYVDWARVASIGDIAHRQAVFDKIFNSFAVELTSKEYSVQNHFQDATVNILRGVAWFELAISTDVSHSDLTPVDRLQRGLSKLQTKFLSMLATLRAVGGPAATVATILDAAGERERESYLKLAARLITGLELQVTCPACGNHFTTVNSIEGNV